MKYFINKYTVYCGFFMISGLLLAQNQKRTYNEKWDTVWSDNTYLEELSEDGNWATFLEDFVKKEDILHLMSTDRQTHIQFSQPSISLFSADNEWFACNSKENELRLINLKTLQEKKWKYISSFEFSPTGDYINLITHDSLNTKQLKFLNLKSGEEVLFPNAKEWVWVNSFEISIVLKEEAGKENLILFNLQNKQKKNLYGSDKNEILYLNWATSSDSFSLMEIENDSCQILVLDTKGNIKSLLNADLNKIFPGYEIQNKKGYRIGDNIFFYRKPIHNHFTETVEVWNTSDPMIFPRLLSYKNRTESSLLTGWNIKENRIFEIATIEKPSLMMNPELNFALVFSELTYEPSYKEYPYVDLYAKDLNSGQETLISKKVYMHQLNISISPSGNHIAFFKDNQWWIWDVKKQITIPVITTEKMEATEDEKANHIGLTSFELPFWAQDGNHVYLTDKWDIWKFNLHNKTGYRITNGRKEKVKYRISRSYYLNNPKYQKFHVNSISVQVPDDDLIIGSLNRDYVQQYYQFDGSHLTSITNPDAGAIEIIGNKNRFLWKEAKYNIPPSIHFRKLKENKSHLLYWSNKDLLEFDLGYEKIISYKDKNNNTLNGILFYPANYDPSKKYPLIVHIYEKKTEDLNHFGSPSFYDSIGFNLLKYTTNDYFVLYPDIIYEIGNPGISALNAILASIEKTTEIAPINTAKIGLYGHSFGGYEAAFIATQTDIFATAIEGAGITDFHSFYHSIGWNWNNPEIWRFESGQMRMGDSFYASKEKYLKNSPLENIEKLNTPLLLWAGKQDLQVHWTQSLSFFLAMKRLKKEGKLLLYDDNHALMDEKNQLHLSKEIFDWFNFYLK